jgi:hypothetical protein
MELGYFRESGSVLVIDRLALHGLFSDAVSICNTERQIVQLIINE